MWKWKENLIVQATLKKESKFGGCTLLDFHSYSKAALKKRGYVYACKLIH